LLSGHRGLSAVAAFFPNTPSLVHKRTKADSRAIDESLK
jgi:hypothetical protein